MDTRNKYQLPPIAPPDSPALVNPAHSSTKPACDWENIGEYSDIKLEASTGSDAGIAKITINRPGKRNAFRPQTVTELIHAFEIVRDDPKIGVVILTGQGDLAFCSGGDQSIRGDDGYIGDDAVAQAGVITDCP